MKIIPQSYIDKMTDDELAALLLDSGPLSPKTRERAEFTQIYREEQRKWNANTATS